MKKGQDIRSYFLANKIPSNNEIITEPVHTNNRSVVQQPQDNAIDVSKSASSNENELFSTHCHEPNDLGTKDTGPVRPTGNFKKTLISGKWRSFSEIYYKTYEWLEYSEEVGKIFCFCCRNFGSREARQQNERFVVTGFEKWKKIGESLKKHDLSSHHIECFKAFKYYKTASQDIHSQIVQHHLQTENENTEYLNKLIGIVLLLARQGLPFRGHREHSNSKNRGNFLEFAEFMAQNESVFKTNFNKSINHTSPDFQNEIIELSAKAVTNVIVEKVKACGFFSLMVDEARCFKEEQLSITIRFAVGVEVEEHFLGFIDCSVSRDASSLQKIILEFLKIRNLENIPIVGQSYDGANVMSGYKN
ncbi:zinc finger MYM-type protein 1-like [Haematobia irritans]|uniref:zinc finger MYM-type protein 1-like n=1 Tax=Haematobia irritans TaxID=7368 RepID=UPI003F4FE134